MIKNSEDIKGMKLAGKLAAQTLEMIGEHVKPGISTGELDKICHDYIVDALNGIPGITCIPGDGAFYAYPCVKGAMEKLGITDDVEFAEKLLSDAGVALVPGSAFGTPGYMRLSFATSMNTLRDAVARLSKALS